ncbi:MAG: hypothetical protein U5K51_07620 [Flavobacteriaceae bacterium]|nr:hypothetical protein [Flavobacteriaceae bacterium]
MTVATVIYYSGYHPYTLKKIYTPRSSQEKSEQHRFFFWYKKENQDWIRNTLQKVNRRPLIESLLPSGFMGAKKNQKKQDPIEKSNKPRGYESIFEGKRVLKKKKK